MRKSLAAAIGALLLVGTSTLALAQSKYLSQESQVPSLAGSELFAIELPDPTSQTGFRTRLAPMATVSAYINAHLPAVPTMLGFMPAASGANKDITSLAGLTTPLGTSGGGTGKTSFAAGTDYLAPTGSGASLTGITAAQVGALTPTGSGAALTGITAAQVGAQPATGNADGLTFTTQPAGTSATSAATTSFVGTAVANLRTYLAGLLQQNYTLQVPSAAALRNLVGFSGVVVHRGGYAVPGDGGAADYVFNASACQTDDGGACLNASGGGSWVIDWTSVKGEASPCLFEAVTSGDDTKAIQAAENTGRSVTLVCKGTWIVTSDISRKTNGQVTHGASRDQTQVYAPGPASGFTKGIFVDSVANVDRDYTVYNAISSGDPSTQSGLTQWPPFFFKQNTPRFTMERMGAYRCTICVDMRGNSGGATINDLQFSAFTSGIEIDGSLDTVRIINPHWYPFFLTPNETTIFNDQSPSGPAGIHSGRMDDLEVMDGLFLGGTAFRAYAGTGAFGGNAGNTFGTFTNTDFDTLNGINMSSGNVTCASCIFDVGNVASQAINLSGNARLHLSGSQVGIGAAIQSIPIVVAGTGNAGVPMLTWNGGEFAFQAYFDQTALLAGAGAAPQGVIIVHGVTFTGLLTQANTAKTNPLIQTVGNGRVIVTGNYVGDAATGATGSFATEAADNYNIINNNVAPGWSISKPSSGAGTNGAYIGSYGPNVIAPTGPSSP